MKRLTAILFLFVASFAGAQSGKETGAIKSLCGCYEVDFKYAETFAGSNGYAFAKPYHTGGLEYIVPAEVSPHKIVIQHLLLVEDSFVVKHWREDWEYETDSLWQFAHDATWKHVANLHRKGEWTQTVWEVDDAPRYQGSSRWIDNDGKYYWENTTDAPLPRREYTKRNDYNVMRRTNRIYLTDSGWMHEQDNDKLIRADGQADVWLAGEKGYNQYNKVDDKQCAFAKWWWERNKDFWAVVRQQWAIELKGRSEIHLAGDRDGQKLYEKLDDLQSENLNGSALQEKAKATIETYIQATGTNSTAKQGGN